MISPFIRDKDQIKRMLKKCAKKVSMEDLVKWNTTSWSSMISISAGLDPFNGVSLIIIPEVFHSFLPKIEFQPDKIDRLNAYNTLKNAMKHVNSAILEATREIYGNLLSGGGGLLAQILPASVIPNINLEELTEMLKSQLDDFNSRREFFQLGLSMMTEDEAWTGRHHLFALKVMGCYEQNPDYVFSNEDFLASAEEVGILSSGSLTFSLPK